jgi:hypothetical protein
MQDRSYRIDENLLQCTAGPYIGPTQGIGPLSGGGPGGASDAPLPLRAGAWCVGVLCVAVQPDTLPAAVLHARGTRASLCSY